jgi:hypothetical protein
VTSLDRFRRVAETDAALLDEIAVAMLLSDVAGLQRFLQAREIDLNQRLRQLAAVKPGSTRRRSTPARPVAPRGTRGALFDARMRRRRRRS